jgi:histone deacetylase complex regulatory component SIN3
MELELNETHQLLLYADDVKLVGDNIDTIKKNNESLSDTSKEVGVEVNAGKNHDIRKQTDPLQMWNFEMMVTDRNLIHEDIKRRLNSGNAYHYSVQKPFSSCLLSKNAKIRIHKTVILTVVLFWCDSLVSDSRTSPLKHSLFYHPIIFIYT